MIYVFRFLAAALSIYSLMCAARIVLSWIPGALYTKAGRFLCFVCDPFLNLFKCGWLCVGALDFSPLLAFGVLTMAGYVLQNLGAGMAVTFSAVLTLVIQIAWSIVASILIFLIVILAIRLVVFLTGSDRASPLWSQIDMTLNPFVYSITRFFSGGRPVAYKNALLFAIVLCFVLRVGGHFAISALLAVCKMIPF